MTGSNLNDLTDPEPAAPAGKLRRLLDVQGERTAVYPQATDIACPTCGTALELMGAPNTAYTPPRQRIECPKCHYIDSLNVPPE